METHEIVQATTDIVHTELGLGCDISLIGSRAHGTARSGSDYDFLIDNQSPIPLQTFLHIKSLIDTIPTLAKIDIVDAQRASAEFLRVAQHST